MFYAWNVSYKKEKTPFKNLAAIVHILKNLFEFCSRRRRTSQLLFGGEAAALPLGYFFQYFFERIFFFFNWK